MLGSDRTPPMPPSVCARDGSALSDTSRSTTAVARAASERSSTTDVTVDDVCSRYEALLQHLTQQLLEQQEEIRQLKQAQSAAAARVPGGGDALSSVATHIADSIAQGYLAAADDHLAACMARRLRRVTRKHVRNSLDKAISAELRSIEAGLREPHHCSRDDNDDDDASTSTVDSPISVSPLNSPSLSTIAHEASADRSSNGNASSASDAARHTRATMPYTGGSSSSRRHDSGARAATPAPSFIAAPAHGSNSSNSSNSSRGKVTDADVSGELQYLLGVFGGAQQARCEYSSVAGLSRLSSARSSFSSAPMLPGSSLFPPTPTPTRPTKKKGISSSSSALQDVEHLIRLFNSPASSGNSA